MCGSWSIKEGREQVSDTLGELVIAERDLSETTYEEELMFILTVVNVYARGMHLLKCFQYEQFCRI